MPIASLINNEATITPQTESRRHDGTDGNSRVVDARVIYRQRMIRQNDGEEHLSSAELWIEGDDQIVMTDEVTITGEVRPRQVLMIQKPKNRSSVHHTKVFLK